MLARMTSEQVTDAVQFYNSEPFGYWEAWKMVGTVCAAVFNSRRTSASDPVVNPSVFMPRAPWTGDEPQATEDDVMRLFGVSRKAEGDGP